MLLLVVTVLIANVFLAVGVVCVPLTHLGPDEGPGALGWGQVVRLRHLYAAKAGLHLLITGDGLVRGSAQQTANSLMEISPVHPACVVIRGLATSHFLCMERDGRLYSSPSYSRDECTFREQIEADGYSVYVSASHGVLLSMGSPRQRLAGRDRGVPALAQFLPRISNVEQASYDPEPSYHGPEPLDLRAAPTQEPVDSMDSFAKLSQIIHSPSFHKR